MSILRSIRGMVCVELTSADLSGTLAAAAERNIELFALQITGQLSARMTILRGDYRKLKVLCLRRGDSIRILGRKGLYWSLKNLIRRPVLVAGLMVCLAGAVYLPSRVFFVQVEGNQNVPTRLIQEAAAHCGIRFGANRQAVRSEKVKNALLESVPQLQWAGVNTYGCVAKISVRERAAEETPDPEAGFGHIVALREGVITDCTATRGNLLCVPGQAVTPGEILISGYTDCGLTIRAEQAAGEIYARTRRALDALSPLCGTTLEDQGEERKKISLLLGKKRINLWKDSGIWDTTCDRMYAEYYITLPGGFQLPLALAVERYRVREPSDSQADSDSVRSRLRSFGASYLKDQMVAGSILKENLNFREENGWLYLAGEYVCTEMIGKMQRLEIGETNGEDN